MLVDLHTYFSSTFRILEDIMVEVPYDIFKKPMAKSCNIKLKINESQKLKL